MLGNLSKTISVSVLSGLAIVLITSVTTPNVGHGAKIIAKLGHPLPPPTPLHKWALMFKSEVEKRSGGRMEIKVFPMSQLGTIPRMIEGTQLGTVEIVTIPPGFFTGLDKRYGVLAAPGIFKDLPHAHRTIHDPEFKKAFWPIGESKGLKMIGMSADAETSYASVDPIRKLSDFKGKKLRVFGSKFEIETLRRVGATGVPMPLSEVIPAIQQKTIDGNKAAIVVFVPFKYQTVAKHVLRTNSSVICINRVTNKRWFEKLPADLRKIVADVASETDRKIINISVAVHKKLYKVWTKTGGTFSELSADEQVELDRRLSTVGEHILKKQPGVLKMYKMMKSVAARTK
ncbi:MAG: TRAP transporter substrate-binding protein [Pseudomonadota bacterium]|nr:TRAP transporter substrate-binding protein [Pseudomonadota bacterium]